MIPRAACVAAASVVAKVTRDRMMRDLHNRHPQYRFDVHKGYVTAEHSAALVAHGPCPEHRFSYVNVAAVARSTRGRGTVGVAPGVAAHLPAQVGDNVAMEGGPR